MLEMICGSKPDAESDGGLEWKNFGDLNSCATSFSAYSILELNKIL